MLRHSNKFLEKCEFLKLKGVLFETKPGVLIGRGFADLGYEEFLLFENYKITSIYRGNTSDFNDEKDHFFRVPTVKELRKKIFEYNYDIIDLKLAQGIEASLVSSDGKEEKKFFSNSLEELFLDMLISILGDDEQS